MSKVMIVGLDCAEPSLLLDRWRDELPVLSGLMERGAYGRLTSVIPPITVPAWSCMMASRTPGDLGVYGFRNRSDHSYDGLFIANSTAIREQRLWDYATRAGKPSIVLGVPGTYPPRPLNGVMVSCFLTPGIESQYTFPPMLKREIEQAVGEYHFDVRDFRTEDKDYLLRQVYEMTDRRFQLAEHLLDDEAVGALRHGRDGRRPHVPRLLEADGPGAPKARAREPFESAILDYHKHVDELMGASSRTRTTTRPSSSSPTTAASAWTAASASTSGCAARAADDARRARERGHALREAGIDWSKTVAWGEGRLLLPHLPERRGPRARGHRPARGLRAGPRDLAERLAAIPDENGDPLGTRVHVPEETYPAGERRRARPDRPLRRPPLALGRDGRAARRASTRSRTTPAPTTPTTPRRASSCSSRPASSPGEREGAHLLDVAPTALGARRRAIPASMRRDACRRRTPFPSGGTQSVGAAARGAGPGGRWRRS